MEQPPRPDRLFGLRDAAKPAAYHTDAPLIECTFLEALRDCWPHHYVILVERRPVWDSQRLFAYLQAIMWYVRSWAGCSPEAAHAAGVRVLESLGVARQRLERIQAGDPAAPRVLV